MLRHADILVDAVPHTMLKKDFNVSLKNYEFMMI